MEKLFESKRLIFREMNEDDFDAIAKIIPSSEPSYVNRWISWCMSSYEQYGFGHWAVIYKENNELIGSVGISMQPIDGEMRPEVGYHLRKDYHHQGLGIEAARASRDYYFNHFDGDEVYSYMDADNVASYKTAEANNMKYIKNFIDKTGSECRIYRITRKEWEALYK